MLNWLTPASQSDRARSGVSIAPCVMSVMYLSRDRAIDPGDEILEIAAQRRLAAGERDEHRVEEPRGVGVALELVGARATHRSSSSRRTRSARCSAA